MTELLRSQYANDDGVDDGDDDADDADDADDDADDGDDGVDGDGDEDDKATEIQVCPSHVFARLESNQKFKNTILFH